LTLNGVVVDDDVVVVGGGVVDGDDIAISLVVLVVQVLNVNVIEEVADHWVWRVLKKTKIKGWLISCITFPSSIDINTNQ
jgi:hypothetical protein